MVKKKEAAEGIELSNQNSLRMLGKKEDTKDKKVDNYGQGLSSEK